MSMYVLFHSLSYDPLVQEQIDKIGIELKLTSRKLSDLDKLFKGKSHCKVFGVLQRWFSHETHGQPKQVLEKVLLDCGLNSVVQRFFVTYDSETSMDWSDY